MDSIPESAGDTRQVRVGIAGFGNIGRIHYEALKHCQQADVVGIAALHTPMAGEAPEAVQWYTDYADLLARPDIDLIVICTPSGYHARQAIDALDAGKHVVVEKPVALCVKDARAMLARARARGRFLTVISQHRFDPPAAYVHQLIQDGRLGRPVLGEALVRWYRPQSYYDSSQWRGTVDLDGGALMNQAIHTIDLLRWLMGDVSSVSGETATLTHRMEAEDVGVAALRFASGALGLIAATTSAWPGMQEELNLFFERGAIGLQGTEVSRWEVEGIPAPASEASEGGGASSPTGIGFAGHLRQWRNILEAVTSGRQPMVSGEDATATLALVLAVSESNRTGKAVSPHSA